MGHPEYAPRAQVDLGHLLYDNDDTVGAIRAFEAAAASGHPEASEMGRRTLSSWASHSPFLRISASAEAPSASARGDLRLVYRRQTVGEAR
jgi:hypothetical protein